MGDNRTEAGVGVMLLLPRGLLLTGSTETSESLSPVSPPLIDGPSMEIMSTSFIKTNLHLLISTSHLN